MLGFLYPTHLGEIIQNVMLLVCLGYYTTKSLSIMVSNLRTQIWIPA